LRISSEQIIQIHESIKFFFRETEYTLYLYGSRTKDYLKGGDIDLLLLTTDKGVILFKKFNLDILIKIKKNSIIGDRRIDLKAATPEDLNKDPFLKLIKDELIQI
jgi:predicted nucleotidyltransferase